MPRSLRGDVEKEVGKQLRLGREKWWGGGRCNSRKELILVNRKPLIWHPRLDISVPTHSLLYRKMGLDARGLLEIDKNKFSSELNIYAISLSTY